MSKKVTSGLPLFLIIGIPFALWAGWGLAYSMNGQHENTGTTILFDIILLAALFLGVKLIYAVKDKKITVVPGQGIEFEGQTLAFKDLESLGERDNPSVGSSEYTKYLIVVSHGTKIRLTDNIKPGIAKQLREGLMQSQS